MSTLFVLTAEAPGWAATTTVADRTFPANAAALADVATSIRAEAAYSAGYTGKGVGIALIDTGVVPVQGLTSGNIVNGPDLSLESQVQSLRSRDGYGHGTHMAGIIAGRDSAGGTGFRGIAPDAKLTSIKVGMSNGAVDVTQVMAAIDWVVEHRNDDPTNPIRVINLSYGLDCTDCANSPVAAAVANAVKAGVMVVVAAGNTGAKITVPATSVEPIVVGSLDTMGTTNPADDTVSSFSSNDGRVISLDVLAPGRSIVSLRDPGSYADANFPSARVGERYMKGSGTSQAAAVTSGAIALYLQKNPTATIADVRNAIWSCGSGMLGAPGKLDVGKMLAFSATTSLTMQSSGTMGTLQASRGSSSVYFGDGTPLSGERDIFGPLSVSDWAAASAAQTSWNGGSWMGRPWTGTTWAATADGQGTWAGVTWSGRAWSGRAWSDVAWAGRAWSGRAWSGASLTGSAWTGTAWSGALWQ
jgi:serine protease AprX